jgi:hypothetical protein
MNNKYLTDELINDFTKYRNCILYDPFKFPEVYNNGFETQTFGRTYLTKFKYKHSQKDKTNEQIKNNLLTTLYNKKFKYYKLLDNSLILTNNKYPYISTNNNPMFIIWDIRGNTSISDIEQLVNKYFSKYNYLVWRNPYIHQSVKLIKHYHLVIRNPIIRPILKKVLLVVRHGPREPIHLPSNFDSSYWTNNKNDNNIIKSINARMTCLGKLYCQYRGQETKKYYENEIEFNKLTLDDIYVESSYIERTRESALYYLKGLGFDIKQIIISKFMASDKLFGMIDLVEYDLFIKKFNLNIDTNNLNLITEEITGEQINCSMDYFHIYSTIKCYKVHNYNLPDGLDKIYDLLEQIATLTYNKVNESNKNKYAKYLGNEMLMHIFELLREDKKLFYLSTHDNMIISLLKFICYNYDIKIQLLDIPDFCSCIRFEIWNDNILRIYYDSLFLIEVNI